MKSLRWIGLAAVLGLSTVFAGALVAGCGLGENRIASCAGNENCTLNCTQPDCAHTCSDNADCVSNCTGDNCGQTCRGNANCTFNCTAGGCS
jgi:hypothetical protein